MASTFFHLQIEGMQGESQDVGFENQIDVQSWSWGCSNAATLQGGGWGSGKSTAQDFHYTMFTGKSSPKLQEKLNMGEHIPQIVLTCSKTTGADTPEIYLTYTFKDVAVASFQTGGATDPALIEQISMAFAEVHVEYKEQKTTGGTLEVASTTGWSYKANQKLA